MGRGRARSGAAADMKSAGCVKPFLKRKWESVMKESYLTSAFRETVHERFFAQEAELTAAFTKRLQELRRENAGATKEKQRHLEGQILPGIAAYETLQTVLPKEEALQTVHGYVERRAWRLKRIFLRLMRIPGLYRRVPGIFSRQTPKLFGKTAGFAAREIQTTGGVWRIDMTRCPYHDACVHYGCPELCPSFCDSDDITYDGLHPRLCWRRTKTLGRGDDCCDFCLRISAGGSDGSKQTR